MSVALKPLSEGLGLNYKAVHRSPSAPGFQKALRLVKRPLELLHGFLGPPESIRAWLNTPHLDLDGATALETILEGRPGPEQSLITDPWRGWEELRTGADSSAPYFGAGHPGVIWLDHRPVSSRIIGGIGLSSYEWIGNHYRMSATGQSRTLKPSGGF